MRVSVAYQGAQVWYEGDGQETMDCIRAQFTFRSPDWGRLGNGTVVKDGQLFSSAKAFLSSVRK